MKKFAFLFLILLIPAFMFVGCGQDGVKNKTFVIETAAMGESDVLHIYGAEGKNLRITFYNSTYKVEVGQEATLDYDFYYGKYTFEKNIVTFAEDKNFESDQANFAAFNFGQLKYENEKLTAEVLDGETAYTYVFKQA